MSINLTQKIEYETDDLVSFEKVLDVLVKIMYGNNSSKYHQLFVTKNADSFDDGKQWISYSLPQVSAGWSKPKFLHVCSIGNSKSGIKPGDETFNDYASLIQRVIENLENADVKEFFSRCSNGYSDLFNYLDGSVETGFRLSQSHSWDGNLLNVSLCHIYYGK